ncbi:MAG: aminoglycoside 6-adenylyltransferase [Treponema sp.]|nr:aminoglycoside 6-adenylyltransferase [Treponema sp.]
MRSEEEIFSLILDVAKKDDRIRAVVMGGSRANPEIPKDRYQDYDISYYVTDMGPFFNNSGWAVEKFGKPLIMQMPEAMRYPEGDGNFVYLMIFPDGIRIDLGVIFTKFQNTGEPAVVLLDKDNGMEFVPQLPPPNGAIWHIKPPSALFFSSCCNNFWWCLNNVAKGIARDELPYVMYMINDVVRPELDDMVNWYIGSTKGFSLSTGKNGKFIKRYLPPDIYESYVKTYFSGKCTNIWAPVYAMGELFHSLALKVAGNFDFVYRQDEEDAMVQYMRMVQIEQKNDKVP